MRWPSTTAALMLAVAVLAASPGGAVAAAPPPQPHPSAFYTPPHPLPSGRHGQVIRARRIASRLGAAGRMTLLLYRSVDAHNRPVAVSGTLLVPTGRAPKGGWPIVSWAHGTTGIADVCAPSLTASATRSPIQQQIDSWVKHGYAVARTDYAGLGTPGTHPYLMGRAEGRNVIDIVRAARQVDHHLSRRWVAAGHSEGGQAALFAGADAAHWAPELQLRGVAALAPASHIGQLARAVNSLSTPSPLSGYAALILEGAAAGSNTIHLGSIESSAALALRPRIGRECLTQLEQPDEYGALAPADVARPGADLGPLYRVLDAQNPAVRVTSPIRLLQGDQDTTVGKGLTDELAGELRAQHDHVAYTIYPGIDHIGIVAAARSDALRWLRSRLR